MKSILMLCTAAALAAGVSAAAAEPSSFISTAAWRSSYASPSQAAPSFRSRSASSLLYTDGAGRLTSFDMTAEDGVMTVTIRQDGAVVWRRSYAVQSADFAVSRRDGGGRVYFLITAGGHLLRAEPDASGAWDVRPAGEDARVIPL